MYPKLWLYSLFVLDEVTRWMTRSYTTKKMGSWQYVKYQEIPFEIQVFWACDALVHAHGALKGLAASLMKIANDVKR